MIQQETYTGIALTKSAELPVTMEEARAQLRLDELAEDDAHVEGIIRAVCDWIERIYGVALLTTTVVETHSAFPDSSTASLFLAVRPGASVSSVAYVDSAGATQTFSSGSYETGTNSRGLFIIPKVDNEWPTDLATRPDAVRITYTAGYGAGASSVPAPIKMAVLNLVGKYDANREDPISERVTASDILLNPFFHYAC